MVMISRSSSFSLGKIILKYIKKKFKYYFFQILWKSRCDILVTFPSHLKKLRSIYWDFDWKSWIVDFFTRFTHEKTPQNNFSLQNFIVEKYYFTYVGYELETNSYSTKTQGQDYKFKNGAKVSSKENFLTCFVLKDFFFSSLSALFIFLAHCSTLQNR